MFYRVDGYDGIAWQFIQHPTLVEFDEYGEAVDETIDPELSVMVMVGDDRRFTFETDQLHIIENDAFCRDCGQIGCGCNVYE
jgi:hypothetical protein